MRYAEIKHNDIVNGQGVCVSFWVQGCPHHCKGCFNPEQWVFEGGQEFTPQTLEEIKQAISANGIQRNLSILGGEPLCPENAFLTAMVISEIKKEYPDIKIFVWTGYLYETIKKSSDPHIQYILNTINLLIDGPYKQEERDLTLSLRGSRNQRIIELNH